MTGTRVYILTWALPVKSPKKNVPHHEQNMTEPQFIKHIMRVPWLRIRSSAATNSCHLTLKFTLELTTTTSALRLRVPLTLCNNWRKIFDVSGRDSPKNCGTPSSILDHEVQQRQVRHDIFVHHIELYVGNIGAGAEALDIISSEPLPPIPPTYYAAASTVDSTKHT